MRTFLIAYDLAQPQLAKHAIAAEIMRLGESWARPLEQTWYVRSEAEAGELDARLAWMLGPDDALLIQPVEETAILMNTHLRWFRRRQQVTDGVGAKLIQFPTRPDAVGDDEEAALAEAC
jgi:hypothetical protein